MQILFLEFYYMQSGDWQRRVSICIIFSTLWGISLKEWKGTSKSAHTWMAMGLIMLIISAIVIGYGNKMGM